MFQRPPCGLFITGTNTDVGKTYVSAMIARQLRSQKVRVGVYKPVASGCIVKGDQGAQSVGDDQSVQGDLRERSLVSEDAIVLWEAAGRPRCLHDVCPQRFSAPVAPHLAAIAEGKTLDRDLVRSGISVWADGFDIVIVEGAGGLMSPLNEDEYFADLAAELGYPMIVVTPNQIGAINQTLQTLMAAENFGNGLPVAGIVLNDVSQRLDESAATNRQQIAARTSVPVLGHVSFGADEFESSSSSCVEVDSPVDWLSLARGESR